MFYSTTSFLQNLEFLYMTHFPFSFFLLIHLDTFCSTVAFS